MTKAQRHRYNAKTFIADRIKKSEKSYKALMVDLKDKLENWRDERRKLSYINVFDLTDEQYERKNYLEALIIEAEILLSKF